MANVVESIIRVTGVDNTAQAFKSVGKGAQGLGQEFDKLKRQAVAAIGTIASAQFLRAAFNDYAKLEKQLQQVGWQFGLSGKAATRFAEDIKRAATDAGQSVESLATSIKNAQAEMNVTPQQALQLARLGDIISKEVGGSAEDATQLLTEMFRTFDIGADKWTEGAATMTQGLLDTNVPMDMLRGRAERLAEALGYKGTKGMQEFMELIKATKNHAKDARGTLMGLEQIVRDINDPKNVVKEIYGLKDQDAERMSKVWQKRLDEVRAKGGDVAGAFAGMVESAMAQRGMEPTLANLQKVFKDPKIAAAVQGIFDTKHLAEFNQKATDAQKKIDDFISRYSEYMRSASGQSDQLNAQWEAFKNEIGATIVELNNLYKVLGTDPNATALQAISGWLKEITEQVQALEKAIKAPSFDNWFKALGLHWVSPEERAQRERGSKNIDELMKKGWYGKPPGGGEPAPQSPAAKTSEWIQQHHLTATDILRALTTGAALGAERPGGPPASTAPGREQGTISRMSYDPERDARIMGAAAGEEIVNRLNQRTTYGGLLQPAAFTPGTEGGMGSGPGQGAGASGYGGGVGPGGLGRSGGGGGGGRGQPAGTTGGGGFAGGASPQKRAAMMNYAMDQLRKEGVPEQSLRAAAAQLVGQAESESGLDPTKVHDSGTGYGIYGARDPGGRGRQRRSEMLAWMKEHGYAPDSAEGQMRYMAHEAMMVDKNGRPLYPKTREALIAGAGTSATSTITGEFEAPKRINDRRDNVTSAYNAYGGDTGGLQGNVAGGAAAAGSAVYPATGTVSPHGYWGAPRPHHRSADKTHAGMDIAGEQGSPISAAFGGTVISAQMHKGYGMTVDVQNDDGTVSRYAHLDPNMVNVQPGQRIKAGDQIGGMGHSGNAGTFNHLHYERRSDAGYGSRGTMDPSRDFGGIGPGGKMAGGTPVTPAPKEVAGGGEGQLKPVLNAGDEGKVGFEDHINDQADAIGKRMGKSLTKNIDWKEATKKASRTQPKRLSMRRVLHDQDRAVANLGYHGHDTQSA